MALNAAHLTYQFIVYLLLIFILHLLYVPMFICFKIMLYANHTSIFFQQITDNMCSTILFHMVYKTCTPYRIIYLHNTKIH